MRTIAIILTLTFAASAFSWILRISNSSDKTVTGVSIRYEKPCQAFTFGPLKPTVISYETGGGGKIRALGAEKGESREVDAKDCSLRAISVWIGSPEESIKQARYLAPAGFFPELAPDGSERANFKILNDGDSIKVVKDDVKVAPSAPMAKVSGITKNIDAGLIRNQKEAEIKCPNVCLAEQGQWNGNWWLSDSGAKAVCSCNLASAPTVP